MKCWKCYRLKLNSSLSTEVPGHVNVMIILYWPPSVQWCVYTPQHSLQPEVSLPPFFSSKSSMQTFLETDPNIQARKILVFSSFLKQYIFKDIPSVKKHTHHFLPCWAISISLRPKSACLMFLMQKSLKPLEFFCCLFCGDSSSSELSLLTAIKRQDKMFETVRHRSTQNLMITILNLF